jgi:iron(III) transport system substrate-binding protein
MAVDGRRAPGGFLLATALVLCLAGAPTAPAAEVVVYTSVDQIFAEPILKLYETETGIRVKALYDVEAAKTVGLVNRLIAEKPHPRADVFWNSEIVRTIILKQKGVLAPYRSPRRADLPATFKDPDGYWTGFSARSRILLVNTRLVPERDLPRSILELTEPRWKGKTAIAYPLFGTTATHVAALYEVMGAEKTESYLRALVANQVMTVDGNSVTRDLVVEGTAPVGFTDTDDAQVALARGKPVRIVYPDQEGMGTLLIPNTVALVRGGPHPAEGEKIIDFLLSERVESLLAFGEAAQVPLRAGVEKPAGMPDLSTLTFMKVDYEKVAARMEQAARFCQELFIR